MLLVSGLWNNFAKLGLPVLALVLLAFTAPPDGRAGWWPGWLGVAALAACVLAAGAPAAQPRGGGTVGTGRPHGLGPAPAVPAAGR